VVDFKIMVVEDNLIFALDLQSKMESWGYNVGPVISSGEEAIEESFLEKPDLIIMDIGVKGELNGVETARKIMNLHIPLIYVTGQGDEAIITEAAKTVPYAILKKPVDYEVLKHKIRSALELKIRQKTG
jgi:CheY-like chemotaxis protein